MEEAAWAEPLYRRVLERAGVEVGTTLLDLGCGPGSFAAAAVGRGALVTGIDLDRGVLRAAATAVPTGRFVLGDAHDPSSAPLPPGSDRFDAVVAVQLLAHVTNPVLVLRRAAALGEVVVATVWGRDDECDVRILIGALAPWLPPRRPPTGPPPVTDPARLRRLGELAGLDLILDEVVCSFTYPHDTALLGPLLAAAPGRRAVAVAGERAVRHAVLEAVAPHRTVDGGYRLDNLFRVASARTPGIARPTS